LEDIALAIKTFKPYTQSRRKMTISKYTDITRTSPEKSLIKIIKKTGGRNNTGRVTVRFRGGGHKRFYRNIDFKRNKYNMSAKVMSIEYDPNRSCRILLLQYSDGEKRYIMQPIGVKIGDLLMSGPNVEVKIGNSLPIKNIPIGTFIHNIEILTGKGGQLVRSAGTVAQLLSKEKQYANVRMPSGEIRLINLNCYATIGQVGNIDHNNIIFGSAGRLRHLGRKSHVRGTAMNAVDHPHGGGRGKSKGNNQPRSPWNQPSKGFKTRKRKNFDWVIVSKRYAKGRK
jgi:large subunit ribosomal protein L2